MNMFETKLKQNANLKKAKESNFKTNLFKKSDFN